MNCSPHVTRAALLGLAATVVACDVVSFVQDPKPRFIQTWNLPASNTAVSVASLMPTDVSIYSTPGSTPPDSSAFLVNVDTIKFSARAGDDCPACQTLNGTTAPKPAFTSNSGGTSPLPSDFLSGAILGGSMTYAIRNGYSFDPLRVSANPASPQGTMVIIVRSGSLVLGRDTVKGTATTLPPGTTLSGAIPLTTGTISGSITVDVVLDSPAGDSTYIDADGLLSTTASITDLRVGDGAINVPSAALNSGAPQDLPNDLDQTITDHVISGALEMTIDNPFAVTGNVDVVFTTGPNPSDILTKTVNLTASSTAQVATVTLDSLEMTKILTGDPNGNATTFVINGTVTAAAPIVVTPRQVIALDNRLVLTVRTGGGN